MEKERSYRGIARGVSAINSEDHLDGNTLSLHMNPKEMSKIRVISCGAPKPGPDKHALVPYLYLLYSPIFYVQ